MRCQDQWRARVSDEVDADILAKLGVEALAGRLKQTFAGYADDFRGTMPPRCRANPRAMSLHDYLPTS